MKVILEKIGSMFIFITESCPYLLFNGDSGIFLIFTNFLFFREISEFQTYEWLLNETNKGSKSDILRYEVFFFILKKLYIIIGF